MKAKRTRSGVNVASCKRAARALTRHWTRRSVLLIERLESRDLLAGDALALAGVSDSLACPVAEDTEPEAEIAMSLAPLLARQAESEGQPEGEDAPDLVAFAKLLTDSGAKLYGSYKFSYCTQQKAAFEDGAGYLHFLNVLNPDGTLNDIGIQNNISFLPTWILGDGTRLIGLQTLQQLSVANGIAIPTSSQPSLAPIEDSTLLANSPLYVPLDGYDPNGEALTYSVTSNNPQVTATIPQGNPSMRISVQSRGDMVFQLFEDKAPRPAARVTELAQADFYDGLTFHRVIEGFAIFGGDPTGTGSGGSALGSFDDQFHVDLQHNRAGVLSYAKSSDDTNDSQFFVTLGSARHLDFDHSIFGLLVEGYSVLDGIAQVQTDANDQPLTNVVMDDVSIFNDSENAVLMLKAPEGYAGEADITVTVTDPSGHSAQQTFHVDVLPDIVANGGANGGPFLEDIAPVATVVNAPVQIQLSAVDVEGDAVYYEAASIGAVTATVNVDHETGLVTVTPPEDYVGQLQILAGVRDLYGSDTADTWDMQLVTIEVAVTWQNPRHPCDVDANDYVTPEDLLILISYLNAHVGNASLPPAPATPPPFLDVNDDGWCTPSDLLEVVTHINRLAASGGEGESSNPVSISTFPYDSLANTNSSVPAVPTDYDERPVGDHNFPSTDRFAQCAVDIPPNARRSDWADEMLDFRGGTNDGLLALHDEVDELEDTLACILDDVAREWQSL